MKNQSTRNYEETLWGEPNPLFGEPKPIHQEAPEEHPDSVRDQHIIKAIKAVGMRNQDFGLEKHDLPISGAAADEAKAAAYAWGNRARQHLAAALQIDESTGPEADRRLRSAYEDLLRRYGQTKEPGQAARAAGIAQLEHDIRQRSRT